MTRHNLNEHLSWLLREKPCIPTDTTTRPVVVSSFGSGQASQDIDNITSTRTDEQRRRLINTGQLQRDSNTNISESRTSAPKQAPVDMARLRAAATPISKPSLITGPATGRASHATSSPRKKETEEEIKEDVTPYAAMSRSTRSGVGKISHDLSTSDVEILDLTGDSSLLDDFEGRLSPPSMAGRKRKSEEYREDLPRKTRSNTPDIKKPAVRDDSSDSDDFATLEDITFEHDEPPPPYSTANPRSPDRAAKVPPTDSMAIRSRSRFYRVDRPSQKPIPGRRSRM